MFRAAIFAVAITASNGPAEAGAFNPSAGHGVAIFSGTFAGADIYYDGYGRKLVAPGYSKFEMQAHVEYGVTDEIAIVARPRFMSVVTEHARPIDKSGLGAGEFGVQIRLWAPGTWSFAVQALARTPAVPHNVFEDRGGFEARWMTGWGFSVFGLPAFAESHLAIRTRRGRADEALADSTLGLRVRPNVLVTLQTFVTQSLESPRRAWRRRAPLGSGFMKMQIGVVVDLDPRWSLGAAAFRTVVGRDAAREQGLTLSLWRRF